MNRKITHFNFDISSKIQRLTYYLLISLTFYINFLPVEVKNKNQKIISIINSVSPSEYILNLAKTLIFLSIVIIYFKFISKIIKGNIKYKIGRTSVIISVFLFGFFFIQNLIDKNISNQLMTSNMIFFMATIISPILLTRDIYIMKYGFQENVDIKKIYKTYNFSINTILNRSFSYDNRFLTNNGLSPSLVSFTLSFLGLSFFLINKFNVKVEQIIFLIAVFYVLFVNKKSYFKQFILLILSVAISVFVAKYFDSSKSNYLGKGDSVQSANVTYLKTRINTTNNNLNDMYNLLFRVQWNNKDTYLLPTGVYNSYNANYNSWLISPNLRNFTFLDPKGAAVILKTKENNIKNNLFSNGNYKSKTLIYRVDDQKDITKGSIDKIGSSSITLYGVLNTQPRNQYQLPIPFNSTYIAGDDLVKNKFHKYDIGSLSITGDTGYKDWTVYFDKYNGQQNLMKSPISDDLIYPADFYRSIISFIKDANIKKEDPREVKVRKIINYFRNNYKYDLDVRLYGTNRPRSINDFLTIDNRGHCEYFATAMTLILRELGIPSRYVVGYSVNEQSNEEPNMYWVRAKDAHAWVIYWNGRSWVDADPTPPTEKAFSQLGQHSTIYDLIEKIRFKFNNMTINMAYVYIPSLFVFIIFSIFIYKKYRNNKLNSIYFKDKNYDKFKRKIKKYEKLYPNERKDLYLAWALKTNDQKLINIVNEYYDRYRS